MDTSYNIMIRNTLLNLIGGTPTGPVNPTYPLYAVQTSGIAHDVYNKVVTAQNHTTPTLWLENPIYENIDYGTYGGALGFTGHYKGFRINSPYIPNNIGQYYVSQRRKTLLVDSNGNALVPFKASSDVEFSSNTLQAIWSFTNSSSFNPSGIGLNRVEFYQGIWKSVLGLDASIQSQNFTLGLYSTLSSTPTGFTNRSITLVEDNGNEILCYANFTSADPGWGTVIFTTMFLEMNGIPVLSLGTATSKNFPPTHLGARIW